MEPLALGALTVEPTADGQRLRLATTTLSREDAMVLWAYLYDWLWTPAAVDAIVAKVRLELTP